MKVVKAKEMARIESLAYADGASEEAFMESAGEGVARLARRCIALEHLKPEIVLLCGRGNNAGDAYAAGRLLKEGGFAVKAFALAPLDQCSELCQLQANRFTKSGGVIQTIEAGEQLNLSGAEFVIDGLLGTGFHGDLQPLYLSVIERANASGLPILAIDIPSGINGNTGEMGELAIQASDTLFLGLPKTGCFLGNAWNYVGRVHQFDFGLGTHWINQAEADFYLLTDAAMQGMVPPVMRTRHKYEAGYVVGVGGSPGMPGAPMMAGEAALRSGAGIVRLLHPEGMEAEFSGAPYELVRQGYDRLSEITEAMTRAASLFIGPGMGVHEKAHKLLAKLLPEVRHPCVIDADALTLIAQENLEVPRQAILTPHQGEMQRLLGDTPLSMEACQDYVEKNGCILVLKGAPTKIFAPNTVPRICPRGDPGMATAGSGDVLTGIIAAQLAGGLMPREAAELGVYLHAVAGEYASRELTPYCMTARTITQWLPRVFSELCTSQRSGESLHQVGPWAQSPAASLLR